MILITTYAVVIGYQLSVTRCALCRLCVACCQLPNTNSLMPTPYFKATE